MNFGYGKLPPRRDPRTPKLGRYLLSSEPLPTAPQSCGYAQAVDAQGGTFPVYRNVGPAAIGDCTAADQGHRIQVWSANAGMLITPTSSQVLSVYEAVSGYNPATGRNDNGAAIEDVLAYMVNTGLGGYRIDSYAAIPLHDLNLLRLAIVWFGGVTVGLQLPKSAEDQFDQGKPWTIPVWSPLAGGHDVPIVDYDDEYLYCVTWGARQPMSYEFLVHYGDEAYIEISPLFLTADGRTPYNHLDLDQLQVDSRLVSLAA